mmetsp:Transcript_17302/g.43162  ORF Transcript_17302/g.43162 Transcript_17302/m.43162 type:complete len:106 (-) Transcript_17302:70-387(-)
MIRSNRILVLNSISSYCCFCESSMTAIQSGPSVRQAVVPKKLAGIENTNSTNLGSRRRKIGREMVSSISSMELVNDSRVLRLLVTRAFASVDVDVMVDGGWWMVG